MSSVNFFDADGLAGEHRAEIDFFLAQTDTSATGDHDGLIVQGIVDVRQAGVGTCRGLIDLSGTFHVQNFVETFAVEDLSKFCQAGPLLQKVYGGFGRFFFQREMHAFVTAVLLWMAGLDPFDADAET